MSKIMEILDRSFRFYSFPWVIWNYKKKDLKETAPGDPLYIARANKSLHIPSMLGDLQDIVILILFIKLAPGNLTFDITLSFEDLTVIF